MVLSTAGSICVILGGGGTASLTFRFRNALLLIETYNEKSVL